MKTLLVLLLLIPSLSWGNLYDDEIILKCEIKWLYDMSESKEVEEHSLDIRTIQILIFEPMTISMKVQYTNEEAWEGKYFSDMFYATYDDKENKKIKKDYIIDIDRLTGEYDLWSYTDFLETNKKYAFHEFGFCKKSSKKF